MSPPTHVHRHHYEGKVLAAHPLKAHDVRSDDLSRSVDRIQPFMKPVHIPTKYLHNYYFSE